MKKSKGLVVKLTTRCDPMIIFAGGKVVEIHKVVAGTSTGLKIVADADVKILRPGTAIKTEAGWEETAESKARRIGGTNG